MSAGRPDSSGVDAIRTMSWTTSLHVDDALHGLSGNEFTTEFGYAADGQLEPAVCCHAPSVPQVSPSIARMPGLRESGVHRVRGE